MKNSKILLGIVASVLIFSCTDDDSSTILETQSISEEDAVLIIESSMAKESAGLEETTYEYVKIFNEENSENLYCNQTMSNSYMLSHDNTIVQATYEYDWNYSITCNGLDIPQSASLNSLGSGAYSTPRVESQDSSIFQATVTGLQPTSNIMIFNAIFERVGTQQVTTNQFTQSLDSEFNVTLTDLAVMKTNYEIDSGTGTFSLSGTTNQGNFAYSGSIIFNGNSTATITINGNQYTIDLN